MIWIPQNKLKEILSHRDKGYEVSVESKKRVTRMLIDYDRDFALVERKEVDLIEDYHPRELDEWMEYDESI